MREIGYRAWLKEEKRFVYPKLIMVDFGTVTEIAYTDIDYTTHEPIERRLIIEDVVLEQDTGFRDKNGKKVDEGDIVKMPDWWVELKYEKVRFTKLSCGFEPFVNGCFECMSPVGEEVEVVGNIHKNKDLLEYIEKDQKTE
nr:MAG TPA: YopX protein [Caudoviricetes sp.]